MSDNEPQRNTQLVGVRVASPQPTGLKNFQSFFQKILLLNEQQEHKATLLNYDLAMKLEIPTCALKAQSRSALEHVLVAILIKS